MTRLFCCAGGGLSLLLLLVSMTELRAGEEEPENPPQPEQIFPNFSITERMWVVKQVEKKFFEAAEGGKAMKNYYDVLAQKTKPGDRNHISVADALQYDLSTLGQEVYLLVPEGYDPKRASEWGMTLLLASPDYARPHAALTDSEVWVKFKKMCAERKLLFVAFPVGTGYPDLGLASLTLDVVKSVSTQYPGLNPKRTYLFGHDFGHCGVITGILAFNFPQYFSGWGGLRALFSPFAQSTTIISEAYESCTIPYLNAKAMGKRARNLKLVFCTGRESPHGFIHENDIKSAFSSLEAGFKVRVIDRDWDHQQAPIVSIYEDILKALPWLDGDKLEQGPVRFGHYNIKKWPKSK